MRDSLRQLAGLMVVLLVLAILGSSVTGYYLLQRYYHTQEDRHEAMARSRLEQATTLIGNQVQFYRGMVEQVVIANATLERLAFGDDREVEQWSLNVRSLLPGAFGLALAHADGRIVGDPLIQHVGEACESDVARFAQGRPIDYPPMHLGAKGLEHFDLLARVPGATSEQAGVLLVSFHLNNLQRMMQQSLHEGDVLTLLGPDGGEVLRAGVDSEEKTLDIAAAVPGTDWTMGLRTAPAPHAGVFREMVGLNLAMLVIVMAIVTYSTRRFSRLIRGDMRQLHQRLNALLNGDYHLQLRTPAIREIAAITPDIDRLAHTIQEQTGQLRAQALSDPLTGLPNRRHFDILMKHLFEFSLRHAPAILVLIDVNDFKSINDTYGHKRGDQVLKIVGEHLRRNTRASDEVARIGGDEFAVILQEIDPDRLVAWVENFVKRYDQRIKAEQCGRQARDCGTLSIGVSIIDARTYPSREDVVHAADQAMYRAKSQQGGHSRYCLSDSDAWPGATDREPQG